MSTLTPKSKIISVRVTNAIVERAKKNLAKQGLTVSEYIRLSLVKAANNEVQLINFIDTPEALSAKKETENNNTESFDSVDAWWNKLNDED
ncbi:plasmid mobilization protein [Loigolactobacillus iwatensis]|uniref:plasmid mobilization protein n=1 Tax=Loigolactobacillus iwatensis TaxID=1267156 RepID=UPI000F7DADF5|nr:type II toxin-antitoxin system RelB/DinJ family antitoxin [Loigolactobacillus iwatensis]